MTTQTTLPDDYIAEALRLSGSPPISIAILREHYQSAVYSTIWHLAATIHKLREADAENERLRADHQVYCKSWDMRKQIEALQAKLAVGELSYVNGWNNAMQASSELKDLEISTISAKLAVSVEALERIAATSIPGEFMTSEFCKRVSTEALAQIEDVTQ
jgi:hypothetical protein